MGATRRPAPSSSRKSIGSTSARPSPDRAYCAGQLRRIEDEAAIHGEVRPADGPRHQRPHMPVRPAAEAHMQGVLPGKKRRQVGRPSPSAAGEHSTVSRSIQRGVDGIRDLGLGIDDREASLRIGVQGGAGRDLDRQLGCSARKSRRIGMASCAAKSGASRCAACGGAPALRDDVTEGTVEPVEASSHDREEMATRIRQHELLMAALEQRDTEEVLQNPDMAADRALGDRQLRRRRR